MVEKYLKRINYNGPLNPSFKVLQQLQKAHLLSVPFENLDIHYGTPIILDTSKIYAKIVDRHRGGFCYELNGLFYELLQAIGFKVKRVSARVRNDEGAFSPEYDHMALMVSFERANFLVDVGFGKFAFGPLKMDLDLVQKDRGGHFRMEKYNEDYWQVSKKKEAAWVPEYIFTTKERALEEYAGMCHFHQTSPESHFLKKKMCSMPTENGRITVSDDKVLLRKGDLTEEIAIENEAQFLAHLWAFFKIKIQQ